MTARDDLDRLLYAWFQDEPVVREPEPLLGHVLARTARTRRRPSWLIPERWIPMTAITTRTTAASRVPWRLVGIAALLILALVVGAVLIAGSQSRELPAPFGPAANGLVAYSADGDIYVVDPLTGRSTAIVTGPDVDRDPVWSLDGTRIAFLRTPVGGRVRLYVADRDGTDARPITPELDGNIGSVSFSPDGREVVFAGAPSTITIAKVDGSGQRLLDLPLPASEPSFRPPDGAEIAFFGTTSEGWAGVYAVNADGSGFRTLVEPSRARNGSAYQWSPDGSILAYSVADFNVREWTVQVHLMTADGSRDRTLPAPPDALWSDYPTWSNDGKHLVIERGYSPYGTEDIVAAIVPADGSGPGVETGRGLLKQDVLAFGWAPDDSSVIIMPRAVDTRAVEPMVIDPRTAETTSRLGRWASTSVPSWQRLAP